MRLDTEGNVTAIEGPHGEWYLKQPDVIIDEPEVIIDEPEVIVDKPEVIVDKEPEIFIEHPPEMESSDDELGW